MAKPGLAPRQSAVYLLSQVTEEGRLLSELLPGAVERLAPEDRARAQRLASTTLRWMDRADRMLGPHLSRRPPGRVLNILRLGVVELAVDRAAAHGVVDACVSVARGGRETARAAGMVNAVLRRVAGDLARWDALPVPRLPKWLRRPLIEAWTKPGIAAIEQAHAKGAPLDLTPKRPGDAALAARLGAHLLPTGSLRLTGTPQVSRLPGYAEGDWWVQDAAAALPARVLSPRRGERVLDMCAAPGGKTMQIAATGAAVTALDVSQARMDRVTENLGRTGLRADLVVTDALTWRPPYLFDAILLDAPCSATGTIRRHPDLPYARDGSGYLDLFAVQAAMLDRAAAWLKPGGRLVFCTCSLLPDEGEVQIDEALRRVPGLTLDTAALAVPGVEPGWQVDNGLRLRPDFWPAQGGLDGFFIAALRKAA